MSARLLRTAVAVGLVATVATAGLAEAAKRPKTKPSPPVCNLIKDGAGDGYVLNASSLDSRLSPVPGFGQDDAQDILSADVATDAKTLTTVIRVKKAATTSSMAPTGLQWTFSFNYDGVTIQTSVSSDPAKGVSGLWAYATPTTNTIGGPLKATIDTATNEVRATVPLADLVAHAAIKAGKHLDTLSASTSGLLLVPDAPVDPLTKNSTTPLATLNTPSGQTVNGTGFYLAGAPSCVKVGS